MLVEQNLQLRDVDIIGEAYAIAANYLRKTGSIPDSFATNDRLLKSIVELYEKGERNRIKVANAAISSFEKSNLRASHVA